MQRTRKCGCMLLVAEEQGQSKHALDFMVENKKDAKVNGLGFRDIICFNLAFLAKIG